jgi:hypothetical protein
LISPPIVHQWNNTSHVYIAINLFNLCQQSFYLYIPIFQNVGIGWMNHFKLQHLNFNCNWFQCIRVYKDILFIFFLTYLYIKKKLHSGKIYSIYTETYIFDTYIFGTDYIILWSVITKFRCCNLKWFKTLKVIFKLYGDLRGRWYNIQKERQKM